MGCDYTEVCAELISVWGRPGPLVEIVRYQISPALAPVAKEEAAILSL
jgi:hypothetical protein